MPEPRKKLGPRRVITYLTLLCGFVALLSAMGFFVLRDTNPELAIGLGRVVWVTMIALVIGGGGLTIVGAAQAIFEPLPDEEEGADASADPTPSDLRVE